MAYAEHLEEIIKRKTLQSLCMKYQIQEEYSDLDERMTNIELLLM